MNPITSLVSHPRFKVFLLYITTFVILGSSMVGLGPQFPYMSAKHNKPETQYSVLFMCRAVGFILGSFLTKLLQRYFTYHQSLIIGVSVSATSSILFSFTDDFVMLGFQAFVQSIGNSLIIVFVNVSTIQCYKDDNLSNWLQSLHGGFGVGGLVGPFFVYLFELRTFAIVGIMFFILIPFIHLTPSPELMHNQPLKQQKLISEKSIPDNNQQPILPRLYNYMIAGIFFFVVGQEVTYGGWISSYAVLEGFATKEHAIVYSSIFWISITLFRFVFAFIAGKPSTKVLILTSLGVAQAFICFFLIYEVNSELGLFVASFIYGLSSSALCPLLLIVPEQFGFKVTPGQNSDFMISAALGEGVLSVLAGVCMGSFSNKWLFYSMGFFNFFAFLMLAVTVKSLQQEHPSKYNTVSEPEPKMHYEEMIEFA